MAVHQGVSEADPDYRADQGVRARGRQTQIPGAEIPDDGGDEEGKDHGEAGIAADLQDELDREQRDDAESDGAARQQNAEEVEETGPDHRDIGGHCMRIDDGCDGIGRVMEAVDEFEAERDQQRHPKEQKGQIGAHGRAGLGNVEVNTVGREQEAGRENAAEEHYGDEVGSLVEIGTRMLTRPAPCASCNIGHVHQPLAVRKGDLTTP